MTAQNRSGELLDLAKQHVAAEDRRDVEAAVATMTENCIWTWDAFGIRLSGREQVRQLYTATFQSFPDYTQRNVRYYDCGEDVFTVVEACFTHDRDWFGIPASGREVIVPAAAHFSRAADGRLASEHVYMYGNDLLHQLGALPSPNALELLEYVRKLEARIAALESTGRS
jgi:steroid delta-isomerase-like uncharacterized protein